jgi:hypothetical protein
MKIVLLAIDSSKLLLSKVSSKLLLSAVSSKLLLSAVSSKISVSINSANIVINNIAIGFAETILKSDNISISESKEALVQNYVTNPFYFDDDYVGQKYTL